jgi:hypothetical protein
MSQPSNGITPEVIRGAMPPFHLSADLLAATIAAMPPPPPDASQPWRHARITRLLQEIIAYHPADSAQARLAAQLLIVREAADTLITGIHTPGLTPEQQCRLSRSAAELLRATAALERTLTRHQQMPVPFYGTVVPDAVDIAALDAIWRATPPPPAETRNPAAPSAPSAPSPSAPDQAAPSPTAPGPTEPTIIASPAATPPTEPTPPTTPTPPPHPVPTTDPTPEWRIIKLDEGPGWSREVLRHRSAIAATSEPVA